MTHLRPLQANHESISLADIPGLPEIEVHFTACRTGPEVNLVDIIDLSKKIIDRWTFPAVKAPRAVEMLERHIDVDKLPPGINDHEIYCNDHLMRSHVAHLSRNGKLFINVSDNYNGFCVYIIDISSGEAHIFPEDYDTRLMCYTSTGSFSPDNKHWMFLRWPFMDAINIKKGNSESTECEVGWIDTESLQSEIQYSLRSGDENHQITCSPSGRYAVFAPFKWDLNVPYPPVTLAENPEGYRMSNEGGIITYGLVTVDLQLKKHWKTDISVPVLGHFEFDPVDPDVFYTSAHNICPAPGGLMLEGPSAIFKLKIQDGRTVIVGKYSEEDLFRIRQHAVFRYENRTVIAATNFPNYLELINADDMTLWRRIELFKAPTIDLSHTGNAICPVYSESCFMINPSTDGKYIVLGNSECFSVYDVENNKVLDLKIPLYMPERYSDVGHTRSIGE